jgi:excisionase family DNA binding protein
MSIADLLRQPERTWLTVSEVARLLELDPSTVRDTIEGGRLPGERPTGVGGSWRIPIDGLELHLRANGYSAERRRRLRQTWERWLAAQDA